MATRTVKTSVGNETVDQTVARAKAMLSTPTSSSSSPSTGGSSNSYKTSPELTALSIANSPTTTPNRPIKAPTIEQPKSASDIQRELFKASQGEINQINKYAAQQIEALKPRQEERVRENASVNTLTGLAGSTEANRTTGVTKAVNEKENQLVRAEASAKIGGILTGVKTKALEMAQTAREQFRLDTETAKKERMARLEEAVNNASMLAQSGVTYEGLQATDPEAFKSLAETVGGEQLLKAQFTLNRPQEDILDKKIEGGKYVIAYRNPLTGETRIESVDLGLPPQYTKTVDAGNRILAIPDNWDGDPSKLLTINKGLTPGQAQTGAAAAGSTGAYGSDLDALIGSTESIIPSKFGQETFRKNIGKARTEADKISLVASVVLGKADAATKTDFTNQAVGIKQIDKAIKMLDEGAQTGVFQAGAQYAFNLAGKDFDPKLAQINQYLTSAIQPYRNSITGAAWGTQEDGEYQQLFGSTKYSPEELKQRLVGVKDILASKSATALGSYVNPLGLYGDPFNTGSISTGGNDIASRVDAAGYNYEAMKADGLSDSEILSAIGQ
jgi:hypothetical protein